MRKILFWINILGLAISCSFFFFGFNFIDELNSLVSHFFLGAFQFILSFIYVFQRKKTNRILDIHFVLTCTYLIVALIGRSVSIPIDEVFALGIIPCFIAMLFILGYAILVFGKKEVGLGTSSNLNLN